MEAIRLRDASIYNFRPFFVAARHKSGPNSLRRKAHTGADAMRSIKRAGTSLMGSIPWLASSLNSPQGTSGSHSTSPYFEG